MTMKHAIIVMISMLASTVGFAENLPNGMVYLKDIDPTIQQDMRYAGNHNFIGRPIVGYDAAECILSLPAATALAKTQAAFVKMGYSLMVYDCYRPQMAVDDFVRWSQQPNQQQMKAEFYPRTEKRDFFDLGYVAKQSGHTNGNSIDLTIVPLHQNHVDNYANGKQLVACFSPYHERFHDGGIDMGTGYDCMDVKSHIDNTSISKFAQQNRLFLRSTMEKHGFIPYSEEWWHFILEDQPKPSTFFNFRITSAPANQNRSKQMMLVTANDSQKETAVLQRYQRSDLHAGWQKLGASIPIVIGKHGLAQAIKKEGDLRTPVGAFPISFAFGFVPALPKSSLPWQQLTSSIECVDDPNSQYYNQIVDRRNITSSDWHSSEKMSQVPFYKLGAFIAYNTQPAHPGAGSCIFLHIWRNAHTGTAGCIAMDEKNLKLILEWLRLSDSPLVVIGSNAANINLPQ
jgi:D-alanyl-D-alanine dipeptidase